MLQNELFVLGIWLDSRSRGLLSNYQKDAAMESLVALHKRIRSLDDIQVEEQADAEMVSSEEEADDYDSYLMSLQVIDFINSIGLI